jgi:outer membrane murein-binding lipoprotein Lpp
MKKLVLALLVLAVFMVAGCSSLTIPYEITDNPTGAKVGESTATMIGPLLLSGDISLSTAAANGGVTKISTVDRRLENKLFITNVTTIVTGN